MTAELPVPSLIAFACRAGRISLEYRSTERTREAIESDPSRRCRHFDVREPHMFFSTRTPGILAVAFLALMWNATDGTSFDGAAHPVTTEAGDAPTATSDNRPLSISVEEAILLALANNGDLRVEILSPQIRQTFAAVERAAFDPVLRATAARERVRDWDPSRAIGAREALTEKTSGELSIEENLPTGTRIAGTVSGEKMESTLYAEPASQARVGFTVTQALLRGVSLRANLARLYEARLDTRMSEYELRGFIESLVANVEKAYWDLALAERQTEIVEESMSLARKQLQETSERVKVGRIAETELAAAEAEVARRREELIDAQRTADKRRIALLRLISPPSAPAWDNPLALRDSPPGQPDILEPLADHIAVALRMRPELNQARLNAKKGNLEVVRTRNGLLPRLDFFVALGATGYSESFGGAPGEVDTGHYDAAVGLTMEFAPINRAARAEARRAVLTERQMIRSVQNLQQIVELDVRTAYLEVQRAIEQMEATTATRQYRERTLYAETEKFKVGKSTSFLVAQAQRDLLDSRLAEVAATISYMKALVELYRLDGSLLDRRGLDAPGREPVDLALSAEN